jgi:hypothetical protein
MQTPSRLRRKPATAGQGADRRHDSRDADLGLQALALVIDAVVA